MPENPGNNSNPRPNRRGRNRNRNRPDRGPRQDHKQQERRNDRRPPRRDKSPDNGHREDGRSRAPASGPGAWQRILAVLTFGLARPKSAASASKSRKPDHHRAPKTPREQATVPPIDTNTIDTDRIHVGNLSYDATESDLLDVFKGIGKVQNVDIVYNGRTHRSKGFGFVQMMSVADARRAVEELHGKSFMGRILHLGPARSRGRDEREADDPENQP
ncbi:MAG TPA: RNA-binding protein [Verrucomicrobiales bacterium]|nr:RNA-binding protein [Verrucomicrobiales bacterium]